MALRFLGLDENSHSYLLRSRSYEQVRSECRTILNELSSLWTLFVFLTADYLRSMMAEILASQVVQWNDMRDNM